MDEHLSKEEAVRRHRELWNKIAEMQEISSKPIIKDEALDALGYELDLPRNDCWCCEYRWQVGCYECDFCPIEWPQLIVPRPSRWGHTVHTKCLNSYYGFWTKAIKGKKLSEAAQYAKMIAELPEAEFNDYEDGERG